MIVMRLDGGLGNQMFQYAAGRCLALKHRTSLILDINGFRADPLRNYELDCFQLCDNVSIVNENQLQVDRVPSIIAKFMPFVIRRGLSNRERLFKYTERSFRYDGKVTLIPDNSYLIGYWQSYRYFDEFADIIRNDFQLATMEHSSRNAEVENIIRSTNSISLHVRRGDYVASSVVNKYHGTASLEYYKRSIEYVTAHVREPHFFVFSDDVEWTRSNVEIPFPVIYVQWNQNAAHRDLYLMSQCKHNIIANSTFSWWGAWLNTHQERIVVYPEQWFAPRVNNNITDLLPQQWVGLK